MHSLDHPPLTPSERARVAPYVTDVDGAVFALRNLPEVTKGALFARYSRSPKTLRRLLVDEFLDPDGAPIAPDTAGERRAAALYDRVLAEYGDDSVAQLGGAHLAVEGASNVLTKVIQWGRLASYLEQSTRYIRFTDRPQGRYRYHRPAAVMAHPALGPRYVRTLDATFAAYSELLPLTMAHVDRLVPRSVGTPEAARARAVGARALDALRGLLPAATTANVGIFASGQAYEAMLVRMAAHPLAEARACAEQMLVQLREVIPAFLTRVDREDRGVAHARFLRETDAAVDAAARALLPDPAVPAPAGVRLLEFDLDGEERVLAHALWPHADASLTDVRDTVAALAPEERARLLRAYAGERGDRRQRPGRALEATTYTFEIVSDYGAYRDLQRHRMLTLQAQPLSCALGFDVPEDVAGAGAGERYAQAQEACRALHAELRDALPREAQYAVTLAHRIRYTMTLNAREAMHVIELRSQPQGHSSYRAVAQEMHRQIGDVAGHGAIAAMMSFVDHSVPEAGRLDAERRQELRARAAANGGGR